MEGHTKVCRYTSPLPTGLAILTNKQKGSVYGDMAGWTAGKRRQFGVFLLHKAFLSFLLDPPQPVGQDDL